MPIALSRDGQSVLAVVPSTPRRRARAVSGLADLIGAIESVTGTLEAYRVPSEFFADPEQAVASVGHGQSFNLIHRTSYLKVDFFPVMSTFNRVALDRAERVLLGANGPLVRVATREDILLAKLWWYRLGDESSEQQGRDILGIIALNRNLLDHTYLDRWATELGVHDLLDRFLALPDHP